MLILNKIWDGICNWAKEANSTYEEVKESMKDKTNAQLMAIVKSGTSGKTMGQRKAALEELHRRGIIE